MTCPCCSHDSWQPFGQVKDHSVTGEEFQLETCVSCGLLRTLVADPADLGRYYQSKDYISHTSTATSVMQRVYLLARKYTLWRKTKWLTRLSQGNRTLLDYGCGTGDLVAHLRHRGWQAEGMEPDQHARQKAISKGSPVYSDIGELPAGKQYRLITLWHVLEHIPGPTDILHQLKNHLAPEGRIIVAVPNPWSEDARHYGKLWAGLDVPRHLWHFPQNAIKSMAENLRMSVEQIHPMRLDSYYVSLLSEQYSGIQGITRWIKAIHQGLRSNQKAAQTGEWSSLIYILKA